MFSCAVKQIKIICWHKITATVGPAVLEFHERPARPSNKFIKVQITNKSSKEIRHRKLLMIAKKRSKFICLPAYQQTSSYVYILLNWIWISRIY
jgi:hypothetical protein